MTPPEFCIAHFLEAGWYSGREMPVETAVPRNHPAFEILQSFGGLVVQPAKKGVQCATNDIGFQYLPCDEPPISPGCLWDGNCEIQCWEQILNTRLVSVGWVHRGHGELYVARDGRCFGKSQVHDAFYFEGDDFAVAMTTLLLGYRSRPLLNPEQSEVRLYGETFQNGDARIYDPQKEQY